MKHSSDRQIADVLEARLHEFEPKMFAYESDDLETLCELSQTIVMGHEYWIGSKKKPAIRGPHQVALIRWYRNVFEDQICLVLRHGDRLHSYSRRYVLKRLRGVVAHSDNAAEKPKDVAFKHFVFEEDGDPAYFEFIVTFNWLISGGITRDDGNTDSNGAFRHKVTLNDRLVHLTALESLVLSICCEFWFTWQEGRFLRTGIVQLQSEDELNSRFGEDLGTKCFETMEWYRQNRSNDAA